MENVEYVLREMRDAANLSPSAVENHNKLLTDNYYDDECQGWLTYYADRIDAAYKRDLKAMVEAGEIDMRTAMGEVERLREENARLKAELNNDDCLKLANDVDRLRAENARLRSAIVRVHGCLDSTCGSMGVCRTCEFMRAGGAE